MDSQQQQQQNQEVYASSQPYDQSYHNNYYYTQQQDPNQQYPPYYSTQNANFYQNPAQLEIPNQSGMVPVTGVSAPPQTADGSMAAGEVQNGYYQAGPGVGGDGNQPGTVENGLNPVMAAAAMVLAQFAGTMGPGQLWNPGVGGGFDPTMGVPGVVAGPRPMMGHGQANFRPGPMPPLAGGGPFRGTARGNFSRRPFGRGRSGSSFRGRGNIRGRGGPRFGRTHGAPSPSQLKPSDPEQAESVEKESGPSADSHEEEAKTQVLPKTMAPAPEQTNTTSSQPSSRAVGCELCKAVCTSLEILEQHKNGKRHQKNLQKMQKSKIADGPVANISSAQTPETLKPGTLLQGEENQLHPSENSTSEALSHENKLAFEPHSDAPKQPDNSAEPHGKEPLNPASDQRQGMKRKKQNGRGGKRMKQEHRIPKVVIPLICDICNVKCDTQEVFNRHLSGKKHVAKVKRYEGHQATYGSTGLQVLYPPNPIAQTLQNQGSQHGLHLQHSSYPPQGAYVLPETNHTTPAAVCTTPSIQPNPNIGVSNTPQGAYLPSLLGNQGSQPGLHPQHSAYPPQGAYEPPETNHSTPAAVCTVPSIQPTPNSEASNTPQGA